MALADRKRLDVASEIEGGAEVRLRQGGADACNVERTACGRDREFQDPGRLRQLHVLRTKSVESFFRNEEHLVVEDSATSAC